MHATPRAACTYAAFARAVCSCAASTSREPSAHARASPDPTARQFDTPNPSENTYAAGQEGSGCKMTYITSDSEMPSYLDSGYFMPNPPEECRSDVGRCCQDHRPAEIYRVKVHDNQEHDDVDVWPISNPGLCRSTPEVLMTHAVQSLDLGEHGVPGGRAGARRSDLPRELHQTLRQRPDAWLADTAVGRAGADRVCRCRLKPQTDVRIYQPPVCHTRAL